MAVLLLLAGCAVKPLPPVVLPPAAVEEPPPPPAVVVAVPNPAAVAVVHDTAALTRRVAAYVYRRDSVPQVIDRLSVLTVATQRAVAHMRNARTSHGYRTIDIAVARVAADALAAYLAAQDAPAPEPPTPPPAAAPGAGK